MADIKFHFFEVPPSLKNRNALKKFIKKTFKKQEQQLVSLNLIFCTDEYLLGINKSFLKHNTYTDIITFNFSENPQLIEGEIYISLPRVKSNAKLFDNTIRQELHRVIFHGVLHLCGYKDKTATEKLAMRKAEDQLLLSYFK
jgi:probable rRNA maturation factor